MSAEAIEGITGHIQLGHLRPYLALCCCILSCYDEYPDCYGCSSRTSLLCTSSQLICCKPSRHPHSCISCFALDCDLIPFETLCQSRTQLFCQDCRISFPPSNSTTPCVVTLCFITCFYKDHFVLGCCKRVQGFEDAETQPQPNSSKG